MLAAMESESCRHADKERISCEVTGIDMTDPHCLRGTINTYGAVKIAMRWTLGGHCRGTGEVCNLIITTPEMAGVVEVAKRLRSEFPTPHSSSVLVRHIRAVTG